MTAPERRGVILRYRLETGADGESRHKTVGEALKAARARFAPNQAGHQSPVVIVEEETGIVLMSRSEIHQLLWNN